MSKRPQNVKRPWKVEYKNQDGVIATWPSTFVSARNAAAAVRNFWLRELAVDDSYTTFAPVEGHSLETLDKDIPYGFIVYSDGFHTFTIFHREAVYYS